VSAGQLGVLFSQTGFTALFAVLWRLLFRRWFDGYVLIAISTFASFAVMVLLASARLAEPGGPLLFGPAIEENLASGLIVLVGWMAIAKFRKQNDG